MAVKKRSRVGAIILGALVAACGRWKEAHRSVMRRAKKDPELMLVLAHAGAWYLIRMKAHDDRSRVLSGKESHIFDGLSSSTPENALSNSRLLDRVMAYRGAFAFSLRSGVALGDATIGQIRAEIALRYRLSAENEAVARWLEAVVEKAVGAGAGEDTVLRAVVNPEDVGRDAPEREPDPDLVTA